jgi:hypothetical protein
MTTWSYAGPFAALSIAEEVTCGLRTDGHIACTGATEPLAPSGPHLSLRASHNDLCGVTADHGAICYGVGMSAAGPFLAISSQFMCALGMSGEVVLSPWTTAPSGPFQEVEYGVIDRNAQRGCCASGPTSGLQCWNASGLSSPDMPATASVLDLSLSAKNGCAVLPDGSLDCWGANDLGQSTPPAGLFEHVSVGPNHGCAVRSDGAVTCWGRNDDLEATPPLGEFSQVAAGGAHTCGLRTDGTLRCWGANGAGQASPPSGTFTQVTSGGHFSCAIRATDQTVACWGERHASYDLLANAN